MIKLIFTAKNQRHGPLLSGGNIPVSPGTARLILNKTDGFLALKQQIRSR